MHVQRMNRELLNPATEHQWQVNDKTHGKASQAGGFWRNRRQRRKVL